MPAFVVGEVRVTDPARFSAFVPEFLASVTRAGGRIILTGGGGNMEALDGTRVPERLVVIQFPDADAARHWYQSADHQAVLPERLASSDGSFFMIDSTRPAQ